MSMSRNLAKLPKNDIVERARAAGIIGDEERELIEQAAAARNDVIQVDAFDRETYQGMASPSSSHPAA